MKKIFVLLLTLALYYTSAGQSISDYLSVPFPTALTASPDGKTLAWVFNEQGERNIFLAKAPDFKARKVTDYKGDTGMELGGLEFSPDSKTLLFIRGNTKNKSGEAANPALLQEDTQQKIYALYTEKGNVNYFATASSPKFSPDGTKVAYVSGGKVYLKALKDTTESQKHLFQARGNASQVSWSPDGKLLAFTSRRDDHSFIGLFDIENKELKYPDTSLDQDAYPTWSADGKQLAYMRTPNTQDKLPFTAFKEANPWSIRVLDLSTREAAEVFKASAGPGSVAVRDLPAQDERLWWTPNGNLVFPWEKNGWIQLYSLDIASKEVTNLTPGEGIVEHVQKTFNPNELLLTTNIGDIAKRKVVKLNLDSHELVRFHHSDNLQWSPVRTAGGMAYLSSSYDRPAWPVMEIAGKERMLAEELFPKTFPQDLVKPQGIEIKAEDGFKSYAQLLLPQNYDPEKTYPAVIFLHGGSRRQMLEGFNYSLYYSHAYALQQYFAANGYIALTLNYRSGIGYGLDFREADGYGAGGATEVKDVMAAADYLASRKDVDATKIIPWGGSYGGYLTAHALGQAPGKFLAGVDIHGVHDWNKSIPVFSSWYQPEKYPEMAELAFRSSPMQYVKNWKDPVLLIHGDDDRNVKFSESVELIEVLRNQGVQVESLVFPDEVHSFLLHRNWVAAYEATFKFIQNQVQGNGDRNKP
jgi:dipeptidyl aminopeptidase/acylaminoacyl peptidase